MGREKVMKTDKELIKAIEQIKMGEEKGFNTLYSKTHNFVYARARHMMHDEQEAQDLVQEVYIVVYRSIGSLVKNESLYAWLASITMRSGIKMAKKKNQHILLSEDNQNVFEEIPDGEIPVENSVINEENAEILKGLLEKLPAEQKSVIISFYYDGMKVEQIAELAETSEGTIKSRLYLARKRLQEYILELEKKEGCSLRGVSVPLLLLAVKMLLEETALSQASAQGIYNQVCSQVGIQASTLALQSAGLTKMMKGQGTGMKKVIGKLAGLGKVKLAAIATGAVVVIGGGAAIGVYVHNQEQAKETQAELEKEQQEQAELEKEQQALLADLTERYELAEELRDNLILEDAVIDILNRDFSTIKTALDEKTADDETEEIMTTLEKNLEGYRKQNEQYLTEKEAAMYDYHTELFPEEKQTELDNMLAEYQTLFEAVKYKAADKKLDEMNSTMIAFLNENYPDGTTEVAENSTDETNGGTQTGSSQNGTGSNSESGNGNDSNSGNGSNTGNGTGSNGGSGNGGTSGGGTGGGSESNNNTDSGNSGNTGGSSEESTPTVPTARWADGRCTEVENEMLAATPCEDGIGLSQFTSQFEAIAESYVAGNISSGEAEQQIADIVLSNTDMPVINVNVTSWTRTGNDFYAQGIGYCNWCYIRAYYDSATDILTFYIVAL